MTILATRPIPERPALPPRYRVCDRCGITFTSRHEATHCRDCKSVMEVQE